MLKLSIKEVGVPVPPPATTSNPRVEIWRDTTGAVYAYGEVLGEDCWMHVPGLASFRFTRRDDEVAAAVASGVTEESVIDAYQRRVLPMAIQVRGLEILHASAVIAPGGVTALCGVSQTGKSTIAFGLSRRGYRLWGDDALAFKISNGDALAVSLPFELRLRPSAEKFYGGEAIGRSGADQNPQGIESERLAAICVLRRADDTEASVSVRRLSFPEAFPTVLAQGCWFTIQDEHDKRRVVDHYMDLAARTPIYDVTFKAGFENMPVLLDAIEQVLQENGPAASPKPE